MEFPKKGCGKGQNSFSTLEKCMNTCSYNRVTAACPTCEEKLQTEQRPLGKPGLPSQIGQLSPPVIPAQPSMPVQPGKPGQSGIGLPVQPGQPSRPGVGFPSQQGLPPMNGGLAQPVQPGLMDRPGQVSPSNPGQYGQPSGPGVGFPSRQGLPPMNGGLVQPVPGLVGRPSQVSPSLPAQSGNPSGNSVGLPGQPGLPPFSGGPRHPHKPDQIGRPSDSSANLLPNRSALSGQSNGHRVGLPSHNLPSLLATPNARPGQFSRPALPVRPGYGSYGVPPSTTSQYGQRSTPRIDSTGLPALPSVSGTSVQATPNPLPNYPTAPTPSVNLGMPLPHGVPAQNNQPLFPGSTGQPPVERQYRPYRSTNR
ncbi:collagen alpha-2(IV) chain-like [Dermacentor silvarum]|uniref:collagen alpha-2(IV) chain-like n=1 Tax=Dermacentor silvarum TaxID=543639 RepID=UPI002100A7D1|nr:collagen alpha-2(IV) chain-like [Dermacentor silvarum]